MGSNPIWGLDFSVSPKGVLLKRRPKNEDLRPLGLKRLIVPAEGNTRSRNLLRRFGNVVVFFFCWWKEGVTSPEVIRVATGGLTIKKAYDTICLEDFTKRVLGA